MLVSKQKNMILQKKLFKFRVGVNNKEVNNL